MNQDNKSSIFIIAGMHRSGTSLAASLMESAGVNIGKRLMGAFPSNPKGHFENLDFVGFHECALRSQGITQEGWTIQKGIQLPQQLFDKAKLIIAENSTLNYWGWKDPRTTLFLDFWKNLLPQAYFIFIYRSPWEVIDSLYRRGDEIFYSNPKYALQIWMHYNKIILDFYHQFPDKCILLNTDTLIADYTVISTLCINKFGIQLNEPSEGIVDKSLMSNLASNAHRQMLIKSFFPEAVELYNKLNNQADLKCQPIHLDRLEVDIYLKDWVLQDWLDVYQIRKNSKIELERSQSNLQLTQTELERSQSNLQLTQTELERSQSNLQLTQTELERSQSNLQLTQTELERS
ncbi:sulfotransferase, partial [Nostoc sp.]|uniref:sulfotransferase n=1 Tax=Nostoc sp. TaxID=1180 RepID=UPI002FF9472F